MPSSIVGSGGVFTSSRSVSATVERSTDPRTLAQHLCCDEAKSHFHPEVATEVIPEMP
jgi:hypothetical protein